MAKTPYSIQDLFRIQAKVQKNWSKNRKEMATFATIERELTQHFAEAGMKGTKIWLEKRGFTPEQIRVAFVFDHKTGMVYMRKGTKDIMDFEFYGIPAGPWPNVQALKHWVVNRVIRRDPGLREEWMSLKGRGARQRRKNMSDRLTYLFGRAIFEHGLQRYATVNPKDTLDDKFLTDKRLEKFADKYGEDQAPLVVRWKTRKGEVRSIRPAQRFGY